MILCGIDMIESYDAIFRNARLGVVTAPTGVDRFMRPTYEVLAEKYTVTALFAAASRAVTDSSSSRARTETDIRL